MAVLSVDLGDRCEAGVAIAIRFAKAEENSGGEGNAEFSGLTELLKANFRVFAGGVTVDGLEEGGGVLFEHEAHGDVDLGELGHFSAAEGTDVGVGEQAHIKGKLAEVINALEPGGAIGVVGMDFAAEDEDFGGAGGKGLELMLGGFEGEPRTMARISAEVAVGTAVEAIVGGDEGMSWAIGNDGGAVQVGRHKKLGVNFID
jgi:hypothetical protein